MRGYLYMNGHYGRGDPDANATIFISVWWVQAIDKSAACQTAYINGTALCGEM